MYICEIGGVMLLQFGSWEYIRLTLQEALKRFSASQELGDLLLKLLLFCMTFYEYRFTSIYYKVLLLKFCKMTRFVTYYFLSKNANYQSYTKQLIHVLYMVFIVNVILRIIRSLISRHSSNTRIHYNIVLCRLQLYYML